MLIHSLLHIILTVNSDMTRNIFVYGHEVTGDTCIALGSIPCKLQQDT